MILETERLILRQFRLKEAPRVYELASVAAVAATSLNIPHPYPESLATEWIAGHPEAVTKGMHVFAIVRRDDDLLIGSVSLAVNERHHRAELGYWIGQPYWNQGYATEAVRRVIVWGFANLGLNRIFAQHFANNPASGRVMEKAGMRYEGLLRHCVQKNGIYHDTAIYAILMGDLPPNLS